MKKIKFPIGNYYGTPYVDFDEKENKYYLFLENYDDINKVEVSKEFYEACLKEFLKTN